MSAMSFEHAEKAYRCVIRIGDAIGVIAAAGQFEDGRAFGVEPLSFG